jgi:hypothetical protein
MDDDDEKIEFIEYDDEEGEEALEQASSPSDKKLELEYEAGRFRVMQDRNDFFLPHVVDFIKGRQWGNLNPEYQRRLRWNNEKKSKLIESYLMNVPVPPVFLYDGASSKLEVLDGQQRINSIVEFLSGGFELEKLKIWPSLNGRTFSKLPPALKRGLNRAKLSAITLITEPIKTHEGEIDLRAQVFERLNTGGEKLNLQELRNCLYSGPFNRLIVELSGLRSFTDAWEIPSREEHTLSDGTYDDHLKNNKLFSTMSDCQIVLRFFAFRDTQFVAGSTKQILDSCMNRLRRLDETAIDHLRVRFINVLDAALAILGPKAFRTDGVSKEGRLSRPLFDAEMIAIDRLLEHKEALISKRANVIAEIGKLTASGTKSYEMIIGRPNTAAAIKARIDLVEKVMRDAIS